MPSTDQHAPSSTPPQLRASDLVILNAARTILREYEQAATKATYTDSPNLWDVTEAARLSERALAAEAALFSLLNRLNAGGTQKLSEDELHPPERTADPS